MSQKPLVVQTEHLDAEPAAWLGERCELVACPVESDKFRSLAPRIEGLVVRTYTRVDQSLLEALPRLRVVGRGGVGLENIDVPACLRRGVKVVHTPEANRQAVVEYVFALLMDAMRPRVFLDRSLSEGDWKRARRELTGRRQFNELTFGILGFGRIGRHVARIAAALGCRVIYHDLLSMPPDWRSGAIPVTRERLLRDADVLSLHVDARDENRRMVDLAFLEQLKHDVIIVNTARGMLVDNDAMAAFMIKHPQALALLDVHHPEPIPDDYPLLHVENVHLSPHLAASTESAQRLMSWVVSDVWRVLTGERPEFAAPEP
ncbi:MAG: NAD(P)-dependent oxidoreductase [Planctomycetota bacterium]|nr:NAD(P)-dependent oxidoreductase [Planctomycetota bacterium]